MARLWRVMESLGCVSVFGRLVIPPVLQTLRSVIYSTYLQEGRCQTGNTTRGIGRVVTFPQIGDAATLGNRYLPVWC